MKQILFIALILTSFAISAQKKDKPAAPLPQKDTSHLPLEQWAIDDLSNYDAEITKAQKQATDTQTYLQVLQIRKNDLITTLVKSDKRKNKPDFDKIANAIPQGNYLLLQLKKPDTTKVKVDSVKKN